MVCHLGAAPLMRIFSGDPAVIAIGTEYLRIIAFSFFASGLVFVASSMFQAMGNTMPPLIASLVRIVLVAIPAIIVSRMPGFQLRWIWYISLASIWVQLALAIVLLRREFARRLAWASG